MNSQEPDKYIYIYILREVCLYCHVDQIIQIEQIDQIGHIDTGHLEQIDQIGLVILLLLPSLIEHVLIDNSKTDMLTDTRQTSYFEPFLGRLLAQAPPERFLAQVFACEACSSGHLRSVGC